MIGYILLGAWLLTLVILGIVVISTGLPENRELSAWFGKAIYLMALATTFYHMGEHFSNL